MSEGCFTKGAWVTGRYGFKPIELIKPDDRIKNGPLSYTKVTETHTVKNVRIVTIRLNGSKDLSVTPDEKIFVRKRTKDSEGNISFLPPEWVEAGNLMNQYSVGYCLDLPMTSENRLFSFDAKKIAESAERSGFFPQGVFDISVMDQKQILSQIFLSATKVVSMGRGTYIAVGVHSEFMAYSVARMSRNCYQAAVDIEKNGGEDASEYPYFVKIMINTTAAGSFYEDNVVWQPIKSVIDTGQTADAYEIRTDSGNVCLINGLICQVHD